MHFQHGSYRSPQPETPAPDAFSVHRDRVRNELVLAFLREGVGGYPLLLIHGYPETKRIWWRNVRPLVEAGFEVVVPDLRGFGDSDASEQDRHDLVEYSRDLHALMHDNLGHARFAVAGGDIGGIVALDMALRFEPSVERLCFFNSVPPILVEAYRKVGLAPMPLLNDASADYRVWQGRHPDQLAKELDTPERRRRWVGDMYGHRLWAAPNTFSPRDIDFMTEPFAEAEKLRTSWSAYQIESGLRVPDESARLIEPVPTRTLVLYGPEDHVINPDFVSRCEIAFPNRIGPLVVPGAGHFLQWERADVFNAVVASCFGDLALSARA